MTPRRRVTSASPPERTSSVDADPQIVAHATIDSCKCDQLALSSRRRNNDGQSRFPMGGCKMFVRTHSMTPSILAVLAAFAAMSASSAALGQVSDDVVKIGVLTD